MAKLNDLLGLFFKDEKLKSNLTQKEKLLFFILLSFSFITVIIIYFISDSPFDTGDGIVHYQIAKYSWKHPHLFLYLWGKPFFTLVSSPFAQFGFKGMAVFQALNSVAISLFLFDIASKINLKYKWTIPVFVFFAPVFFAVMNSGLAEIFFGTLFTFSAWLVFNKKFYASALIASLLPFVRPEAYVVMPLLIVIFIYRKKYFAIPLLLTATIVYTIIGYFHYNDIWWIINQNYKLIGDNYAGMKGSYFHYFKIYYAIWGTAQAVLLLIGSGVVFRQLIKLFKSKPEHDFILEVFVLFLGCTAGCFVLHSLLCGMPGILNNLGMMRYLATLIPSSVLIVLIGLNSADKLKFRKAKIVKPILIAGFVITAFISPFTQRYFPFKPYFEQYVIKEMADYIKTEIPDFKKVCFLHPSFSVFTEIDPYDENKVVTLLPGNYEFVNQLPDSTLFIWDSHFMEIEGRISKNWLSENPNFTKLKHYKFGDEKRPFEACLFMRANEPELISIPIEIVLPKN